MKRREERIAFGNPYAHVLMSSYITQKFGRKAASALGYTKEVIDFWAGVSGHRDYLYSAFQPSDFVYNSIGREIGKGINPADWSRNFRNTPEPPPGPFFGE